MASEDALSTVWRVVTSYPAVVVAALLVGALLAPIGLQATESSTVAVVPIEGGIDGSTSTAVAEQLRQAEADPDVEAVVLLINSPGGGASASESIYLQVQRLAEKEGGPPVVASVDAIAASGAYFAAAPSDHIYAKPGSVVGSVGTLSTLPQEIEPQGLIAATGPSKVGTNSQREFYYTVETVKNAFANAVMESRGDRLELSRGEVTEAAVYPGTIAVQNGMVDGIGGIDRAVQKAATEAGLQDYSVEIYRPNGTRVFVTQAAYVASDAPNKRLVSPTYFTGVGGAGSSALNVVMLPPQVAYDSVQQRRAARNGTVAGAGAGTATTGEGR